MVRSRRFQNLDRPLLAYVLENSTVHYANEELNFVVLAIMLKALCVLMLSFVNCDMPFCFVIFNFIHKLIIIKAKTLWKGCLLEGANPVCYISEVTCRE